MTAAPATSSPFSASPLVCYGCDECRFSLALRFLPLVSSALQLPSRRRLTRWVARPKGSGMTTIANVTHRPLLPILLALSGAHLLNDLISSMIPAMYPLLKEAYRLDFAQVGL